MDMHAAQKIEKNLETAPIENDFEPYGDLEEFEALDQEFYGSQYLDRRANRGTGQDLNPAFEIGPSGPELGDLFEEERPLKEQLEEFQRTGIANNPNLTAEEKKAYQLELEKWIYSLDLHLDPEGIQDQFEVMRLEVGAASVYPSYLRHLAQQTGKEPAELQVLLKKHGLQGDKSPSLSDARVSALLNDPDFSERVSSLKESVVRATKDLHDEIEKQVETAKSENGKSAKDKDQRSQDDQSYRFLYDAYFHQDEKSKALIETRRQLATETAGLLSALYGKKVGIEEQPEKIGLVSLDGTSLNLPFTTRGDVPWPKVTLVPFEVHHEGSRQAKIPEWLLQANYPMNSFDEYSWRDNAWQWGVAFLGAGVISTGMQYMDWNNHGRPMASGGKLENIGIQSVTTEESKSGETELEKNK